ncbi:MAG: ADP-ribosylglycohydrolase family protein [Oscillospiraceae bacterium]
MIEEKCVGAFVAAAIGDALGWPNEFRASNTSKKKFDTGNFSDWVRRSGGRYWNHNEKILSGEYSDDTQLILSVSRSLLCGDTWRSHMANKELPFWLEYERGGGGALKRASTALAKSKYPWQSENAKSYYDAGGNGAAMRILPHAVLHQNSPKGFAVIANEVIQDSMLTHGHPRAILGALCYSYALNCLLAKTEMLKFGTLLIEIIDGAVEWGSFPVSFDKDWLYFANQYYDFESLWKNTTTDMLNSLKRVSSALGKGLLDNEIDTLTHIGCFDKKVNGAGDVAAIAAIYLASKYANNPILGVKSAANSVGIDTDTIASMTGGLLGTLAGHAWIPAEWKLVQDYTCLTDVARLLLNSDRVSASKAFVNNKLTEGVVWTSYPIGKCREIARYEIPCGKASVVTIIKLITILGQTLYLKKFNRAPSKLQENGEKIVIENRQQTLNDLIASTDFAKPEVALSATQNHLIKLSATDFECFIQSLRADSHKLGVKQERDEIISRLLASGMAVEEISVILNVDKKIVNEQSKNDSANIIKYTSQLNNRRRSRARRKK